MPRVSFSLFAFRSVSSSFSPTCRSATRGEPGWHRPLSLRCRNRKRKVGASVGGGRRKKSNGGNVLSRRVRLSSELGGDERKKRKQKNSSPSSSSSSLFVLSKKKASSLWRSAFRVSSSPPPTFSLSPSQARVSMLRTLTVRALGGATASSSSSASAAATMAASTIIGACSLFSRSYAAAGTSNNDADYGLAAGVPEQLLKREVRG